MVKLKNLSPFRCGIAVVCSAVSLAMSVTSCDHSYADVEKETPEAATVNGRTPSLYGNISCRSYFCA